MCASCYCHTLPHLHRSTNPLTSGWTPPKLDMAPFSYSTWHVFHTTLTWWPVHVMAGVSWWDGLQYTGASLHHYALGIIQMIQHLLTVHNYYIDLYHCIWLPPDAVKTVSLKGIQARVHTSKSDKPSVQDVRVKPIQPRKYIVPTHNSATNLSPIALSCMIEVYIHRCVCCMHVRCMHAIVIFKCRYIHVLQYVPCMCVFKFMHKLQMVLKFPNPQLPPGATPIPNARLVIQACKTVLYYCRSRVVNNEDKGCWGRHLANLTAWSEGHLQDWRQAQLRTARTCGH